MEHLPDNELIGLSLSSNDEAFSLLVKRYSRRIFAICYGIVGKADDAEDLAQETFLLCFFRLPKLKERERFYAWAAQIARNVCVDFLRKQKRNPHQEKYDSELPTPQVSFIKSEIDDVQDAIETLPGNLREPLLLYYFGQESTTDIAQILDITQEAVHQRLSRARKKLRRILAVQETKP